MTIFALCVLAIFTVFLISRIVLLLHKLRDGGEGFFDTVFWYIHFLLIVANVELTAILALSYLYFTPGTANPTLSLIALIANGMITLRSLGTRKIWFALVHLPAAVLTALWAFPALEEWLLGLF